MSKRLKVYNSMTESELILGLRSGDDNVLAFVYNQHYKMIEQLAMRYQKGDEAQDIYQESFMVFLSKIYDTDLSCKASTFLYAVAKNICLKGLRKKTEHLSDDMIINVKEDCLDFETQDHRFQQLELALNKIGDRCKMLLMHFYGHSWRMEEIAEKMSYTNAANAKNQKYKCMKKLKEVLHG